jgi:hypothetical protein
MSEERKMPSWVYTDTKPADDDAYFENLTRCIARARMMNE